MNGLTGEWIWVDDMRPAPEEFARHCKTYNQTIASLNYFMWCEGGIDVISLDHDLGEEKSGYDIAKYIVEEQIPIGAFAVHSANPVGAKNIRELLTHYGYKELI